MKNSCRFSLRLGCLTLSFFIACNQVFAGVSLPSQPQERLRITSPISIPESLGKVADYYPGTSDKLVIHIQDAHTSYEAQKSIQAILHHLNRVQPLQTLLLEGATRPLEPELYNLHSDPKQSLEIAERLLEQFELTGAEMFLLEQRLKDKCGKKCAKGVGIESAQEYVQNIEHYRNLKQGARVSETLHELSRGAEDRAKKILNPELRKYFMQWLGFESGRTEFSAYLATLKNAAKETLQKDIQNPRHQFQYPSLVRYFLIQGQEAQLDPSKIEKEQKDLLRFLKQKGAERDLAESVKDLAAPGRSIRSKLERLYEAASPKGFRFENFPHWSQWEGLEALRQEIEGPALMEEMRLLEREILQALAKTKGEKDFLEVYERFHLMRKLFRLELTRAEWQDILKKGNELFTPKNFAAQFEMNPSDTWNQADSFAAEARQFYQAAIAREKSFTETIEKWETKAKESRAVIVTGGFHAEGLQLALRQKGIAYVSILPHMASIDPKGDKLYEQSMLENAAAQRPLRTVRPSLLSRNEQRLVNPDFRLKAIELASNGQSRNLLEGNILDELKALKTQPRSEEHPMFGPGAGLEGKKQALERVRTQLGVYEKLKTSGVDDFGNIKRLNDLIVRLEQQIAELTAQLPTDSRYKELLASLQTQLAELEKERTALKSGVPARVAPAPKFDIAEPLASEASVWDLGIPGGRHMKAYIAKEQDTLKIFQWNGTEWEPVKSFTGVNFVQWFQSNGSVVIQVVYWEKKWELHGFKDGNWETLDLVEEEHVRLETFKELDGTVAVLFPLDKGKKTVVYIFDGEQWITSEIFPKFKGWNWSLWGEDAYKLTVELESGEVKEEIYDKRKKALPQVENKKVEAEILDLNARIAALEQLLSAQAERAQLATSPKQIETSSESKPPAVTRVIGLAELKAAASAGIDGMVTAVLPVTMNGKNYLAAATKAKKVHLLEMNDNGRWVSVLETEELRGAVESLAVVKMYGRQYLAAGTTANKVHLLHISGTGDLVQAVETRKLTGAVYSLAVVKMNKKEYLAAGTGMGKVELLEMNAQGELVSVQNIDVSGAVWSLAAVKINGREYLAAGTGSGTVHLIGMTVADHLFMPFTPATLAGDGVMSLAVMEMRGKEYLAAGTLTGKAYLLEVNDQSQVVPAFETDEDLGSGPMHHTVVNVSGKDYLAVGTAQKKVYALDLDEEGKLTVLFETEELSGPVSSLAAVEKDGKTYLVAGTEREQVHWIEIKTGAGPPRKRLKGIRSASNEWEQFAENIRNGHGRESVYGVKFVEKGRVAMSFGQGKVLVQEFDGKLWNVVTAGKWFEAAQNIGAGRKTVFGVEFLEKDNAIISYDTQGVLNQEWDGSTWRVASGKWFEATQNMEKFHGGAHVFGIEFLEKGNVVMSFGGGGKILVQAFNGNAWEVVPSDAARNMRNGHGNQSIFGVEFLEEGKVMMSYGGNGIVVVQEFDGTTWETAAAGKWYEAAQNMMAGHGTAIRGAVLFEDGNVMLSYGNGGRVVVQEFDGTKWNIMADGKWSEVAQHIRDKHSSDWIRGTDILGNGAAIISYGENGAVGLQGLVYEEPAAAPANEENEARGRVLEALIADLDSKIENLQKLIDEQMAAAPKPARGEKAIELEELKAAASNAIGGEVTSLAVTASYGKEYLVAGTDAKKVHLLQMNTAGQWVSVNSIEVSGPVNSLIAWKRTEREYLVAGTEGKKAEILYIDVNGKLVSLLEHEFDSPVTSLAVRKEGLVDSLFVGTDAGNVHLMKMALNTFPPSSDIRATAALIGGVQSLKDVEMNGKQYIAAGTESGKVHLLETNDKGELVSTFETQLGDATQAGSAVMDLKVVKMNGKDYLAAGRLNTRVNLLELNAEGKFVSAFESVWLEAELDVLETVNVDGKEYLAAGITDHTVQLFDVNEAGRFVSIFKSEELSGAVKSLSVVERDGKPYLAAGTDRGKVHWIEIKAAADHGPSITVMARNGKEYLVGGSSGKKIRVLERSARGGLDSVYVTEELSGRIISLAVVNFYGKEYLAAGTSGQKVHLFEMNDAGELIPATEFGGLGSAVESLVGATFYGKEYLVVGTSGGTVEFLALTASSGQLIRASPLKLIGAVPALAVMNVNGKNYAAAGTSLEGVQLVEPGRRVISSEEGVGGRVLSLAVVQMNGKDYLAAGTDEHKVHLLEVNEENKLVPISEIEVAGAAESLAVSKRDGKNYLAAGTYGGTVHWLEITANGLFIPVAQKELKVPGNSVTPNEVVSLAVMQDDGTEFLAAGVKGGTGNGMVQLVEFLPQGEAPAIPARSELQDPDNFKINPFIATRSELREIKRYFEIKEELLEAADAQDKPLAMKLRDELDAVFSELRKDKSKITEALVRTALSPLVPDLSGDHAAAYKKEIESAIGYEFTPEYRDEINRVLDEVIEDLYDDPTSKEARQMLERLQNDIYPISFEGMLPKAIFEREEWAEAVPVLLSETLKAAHSDGFFAPVSEKVYLTPNMDELFLRAVLKHELLHYLAYFDVFKIPFQLEIFTFAITALEYARRDALDLYQKQISTMPLKELFETGRALGKNGELGLGVGFATSREKASYLRYESLLAAALQVYERLGLSSESLDDSYTAQIAMSTVLAGNLQGLNEAGLGKPLKILKQAFEELNARLMPPDGAVILQVLNSVETFVRNDIGHPVDIEAAEGYWDFRVVKDPVTKETQYKLQLNPTDLYPRPEDSEGGKDAVREATDRSFGHYALASARYGFEDLFYINLPKEIREHPAFPGLRHVLEFNPLLNSILAKYNMQRGQRLISDAPSEGMRRNLELVFRDTYASLDHAPFVEQLIYASLPVNLAYADSLRRAAVRGENDPRVKKGSEVAAALTETYGEVITNREGKKEFDLSRAGWGMIMMDSDRALNTNRDGYKNEILKAIQQKIWPVYLKLFEKAQRKKAEEKAQLYRNEQEKAMRTEQAMKEFFDSLPEELQEQLLEQALQELLEQEKQMMAGGKPMPMPPPQNLPEQNEESSSSQSQTGQGQGQGQGKPSGKPGTGKGQQGGMPQGIPQGTPGQRGQGGTPSAGGGGKPSLEKQMEAMGQQLKDLEKQLGNLSGKIPQASDSVSQIGQEADKEKAKSSQSEAGQQKPGAESGVEGKAGEIGKKVRDLLKGSRELMATTGEAKDQAQDLKKQSWGSAEGEKAVQESEKLDGEAQKLKETFEKLNAKVNQLLQQAKEMAANPGQDSGIKNAQAEGLKQTAKEIKQGLDKALGEVRQMKQDSHGLEGAAEKLAGKVQKIQKLLESKGDSKPGEGKDSGGKKPGDGSPQQGSKEPGKAGEQQSPVEYDPNAVSQRDEAGLDLPLPDDLAGFLKGAGEAEKEKSTPRGKRQAGGHVSVPVTDPLTEEMSQALYGLSLAQNAVYEKWLGQTIRGQTVQSLVRKRIKQLRPLLAPTTDEEEERGLKKGTLTDVVGEVTRGKGRSQSQPIVPLPLMASFLVDRSGSMDMDDSIQQVRLTLLIDLEAIFEINKLRPKRDPIIFEVGAFEDDPVNIASKKATQKHTKKRAVIFHILEALTAHGGTQYSKGLAAYLDHMQQLPEPKRGEIAKRLLFVFTDEQVSDGQVQQILKLLDLAQKGKSVKRPEKAAPAVETFIAPMGSAEERADARGRHGNHSIDTSDVERMSENIAEQMVKTLRAEVRQWESTPYEDFKITTIRGKRYLFYKHDNPELVAGFEMGPGGPDVPSDILPDITHNSKLLYDLYSANYRPVFQDVIPDDDESVPDPAYAYQIWNRDRAWSLESRAGGEYSVKNSSHEAVFKQDEFSEQAAGGEWRNAAGLRWKWNEEKGMLEISRSNGDFVFAENFSVRPSPRLLVQEMGDSLVFFYPRTEGLGYDITVLAPPKNKEDLWRVHETLSLPQLHPNEDNSRTIQGLRGDPGVVKSTAQRAAAHLLGMPVLYLQGHGKIREEDLLTHRDIGRKVAGQSEYTPSVISRALEEGWWVIIDEKHEISPTVFQSLKDFVAGGMHEMPRKDPKTGVELPAPRANHPRGRVLSTANLNIQGTSSQRGADDAAMQDRLEDMEVTWLSPGEEREAWEWYAHKEQQKQIARNVKKQLTSQEITDMVKKLVEMAVDLRLQYKGFDKDQKTAITSEYGWHLLGTLTPAKDPGELLIRAPSPRVLKQIVLHAVHFPEDWRNRKAWLVDSYFNFHADENPESAHIRAIEKAFSDAFGRRNPAAETPLLTAKDSFQYKDGILIVQPVDKNGQPDPKWDPVHLRVHPDAEIARGIIPQDFEFLLSIPENHTLIYSMLQDRANHRISLLIGENGGGKSTIAEGVAKLLSGPKVESFSATKATTPEKMTHSSEFGVFAPFKTGYVKQIIAQALNDNNIGKTVVLGELNQAPADVHSILNELFERGFLADPETGLPMAIGENFWAIITANPPNKTFNVKAFRNQMLERVRVYLVKPLPAVSEQIWLNKTAVSLNKQRRLHPALIGQESLSQPGKFGGFLGVEQNVREAIKTNPDLTPRIPSIRAWKSISKKMLDKKFENELAKLNANFIKWFRQEAAKSKMPLPARDMELIWGVFHGTYDSLQLEVPSEAKFGADQGQRRSFSQIRPAMLRVFMLVKPQTVFWKLFKQAFTLQGDDESLTQEYWSAIEAAFEKEGLLSDESEKDGLVEYLKGELPIIGNLPLKMKAQTGIERIDRRLNELQQTTESPASIKIKLDELKQWIETELLSFKSFRDERPRSVLQLNWTADIMEKLFLLREIHEVLGVLRSLRAVKNSNFPYAPENLTAVEGLQTLIRKGMAEHAGEFSIPAVFWEPSGREEDEKKQTALPAKIRERFLQDDFKNDFRDLETFAAPGFRLSALLLSLFADVRQNEIETLEPELIQTLRKDKKYKKALLEKGLEDLAAVWNQFSFEQRLLQFAFLAHAVTFLGEPALIEKIKEWVEKEQWPVSVIESAKNPQFSILTAYQQWHDNFVKNDALIKDAISETRDALSRLVVFGGADKAYGRAMNTLSSELFDKAINVGRHEMRNFDQDIEKLNQTLASAQKHLNSLQGLAKIPGLIEKTTFTEVERKISELTRKRDDLVKLRDLEHARLTPEEKEIDELRERLAQVSNQIRALGVGADPGPLAQQKEELTEWIRNLSEWIQLQREQDQPGVSPAQKSAAVPRAPVPPPLLENIGFYKTKVFYSKGTWFVLMHDRRKLVIKKYDGKNWSVAYEQDDVDEWNSIATDSALVIAVNYPEPSTRGPKKPLIKFIGFDGKDFQESSSYPQFYDSLAKESWNAKTAGGDIAIAIWQGGSRRKILAFNGKEFIQDDEEHQGALFWSLTDENKIIAVTDYPPARGTDFLNLIIFTGEEFVKKKISPLSPDKDGQRVFLMNGPDADEKRWAAFDGENFVESKLYVGFEYEYFEKNIVKLKKPDGTWKFLAFTGKEFVEGPLYPVTAIPAAVKQSQGHTGIEIRRPIVAGREDSAFLLLTKEGFASTPEYAGTTHWEMAGGNILVGFEGASGLQHHWSFISREKIEKIIPEKTIRKWQWTTWGDVTYIAATLKEPAGNGAIKMYAFDGKLHESPEYPHSEVTKAWDLEQDIPFTLENEQGRKLIQFSEGTFHAIDFDSARLKIKDTVVIVSETQGLGLNRRFQFISPQGFAESEVYPVVGNWKAQPLGDGVIILLPFKKQNAKFLYYSNGILQEGDYGDLVDPRSLFVLKDDGVEIDDTEPSLFEAVSDSIYWKTERIENQTSFRWLDVPAEPEPAPVKTNAGVERLENLFKLIEARREREKERVNEAPALLPLPPVAPPTPFELTEVTAEERARGAIVKQFETYDNRDWAIVIHPASERLNLSRWNGKEWRHVRHWDNTIAYNAAVSEGNLVILTNVGRAGYEQRFYGFDGTEWKHSNKIFRFNSVGFNESEGNIVAQINWAQSGVFYKTFYQYDGSGEFKRSKDYTEVKHEDWSENNGDLEVILSLEEGDMERVEFKKNRDSQVSVPSSRLTELNQTIETLQKKIRSEARPEDKNKGRLWNRGEISYEQAKQLLEKAIEINSAIDESSEVMKMMKEKGLEALNRKLDNLKPEDFPGDPLWYFGLEHLYRMDTIADLGSSGAYNNIDNALQEIYVESALGSFHSSGYYFYVTVQGPILTVAIRENNDLQRTHLHSFDWTQKENIQIGRNPTNDITIEARVISRRHVVLFVKENQIFITDQNSANGTWVGENRIHPLLNIPLAQIPTVVPGPSPVFQPPVVNDAQSVWQAQIEDLTQRLAAARKQSATYQALRKNNPELMDSADVHAPDAIILLLEAELQRIQNQVPDILKDHQQLVALKSQKAEKEARLAQLKADQQRNASAEPPIKVVGPYEDFALPFTQRVKWIKKVEMPDGRDLRVYMKESNEFKIDQWGLGGWKPLLKLESLDKAAVAQINGKVVMTGSLGEKWFSQSHDGEKWDVEIANDKVMNWHWLRTSDYIVTAVDKEGGVLEFYALGAGEKPVYEFKDVVRWGGSTIDDVIHVDVEFRDGTVKKVTMASDPSALGAAAMVLQQEAAALNIQIDALEAHLNAKLEQGRNEWRQISYDEAKQVLEDAKKHVEAQAKESDMIPAVLDKVLLPLSVLSQSLNPDEFPADPKLVFHLREWDPSVTMRGDDFANLFAEQAIKKILNKLPPLASPAPPAGSAPKSSEVLKIEAEIARFEGQIALLAKLPNVEESTADGLRRRVAELREALIKLNSTPQTAPAADARTKLAKAQEALAALGDGAPEKELLISYIATLEKFIRAQEVLAVSSQSAVKAPKEIQNVPAAEFALSPGDVLRPEKGSLLSSQSLDLPEGLRLKAYVTDKNELKVFGQLSSGQWILIKSWREVENYYLWESMDGSVHANVSFMDGSHEDLPFSQTVEEALAIAPQIQKEAQEVAPAGTFTLSPTDMSEGYMPEASLKFSSGREIKIYRSRNNLKIFKWDGTEWDFLQKLRIANGSLDLREGPGESFFLGVDDQEGRPLQFYISKGLQLEALEFPGARMERWAVSDGVLVAQFFMGAGKRALYAHDGQKWQLLKTFEKAKKMDWFVLNGNILVKVDAGRGKRYFYGYNGKWDLLEEFSGIQNGSLGVTASGDLRAFDENGKTFLTFPAAASVSIFPEANAAPSGDRSLLTSYLGSLNELIEAQENLLALGPAKPVSGIAPPAPFVYSEEVGLNGDIKSLSMPDGRDIRIYETNQHVLKVHQWNGVEWTEIGLFADVMLWQYWFSGNHLVIKTQNFINKFHFHGWGEDGVESIGGFDTAEFIDAQSGVIVVSTSLAGQNKWYVFDGAKWRPVGMSSLLTKETYRWGGSSDTAFSLHAVDETGIMGENFERATSQKLPVVSAPVTSQANLGQKVSPAPRFKKPTDGQSPGKIEQHEMPDGRDLVIYRNKQQVARVLQWNGQDWEEIKAWKDIRYVKSEADEGKVVIVLETGENEWQLFGFNGKDWVEADERLENVLQPKLDRRTEAIFVNVTSETNNQGQLMAYNGERWQSSQTTKEILSYEWWRDTEDSFTYVIHFRNHDPEQTVTFEKAKNQNAAPDAIAPAAGFILPEEDALGPNQEVQKFSMPDGRDVVGYLTEGQELKFWQWNGAEWKFLEHFVGGKEWRFWQLGGNLAIAVKSGEKDWQFHGYNGSQWKSSVEFQADTIDFKDFEANLTFGVYEDRQLRLFNYNGVKWQASEPAENVAYWEPSEITGEGLVVHVFYLGDDFKGIVTFETAKVMSEVENETPESLQVKREQIVSSIAALQARANELEARLPEILTSESERARHEFREAVVETAMKATQGVFSVRPEDSIEALEILRRLRPDLFSAEEKPVDFRGLMQSAGTRDPAGIVRLYSGMPSDHELDLLSTMAARNPMAQFLIVVPDQTSEKLQSLSRALKSKWDNQGKKDARFNFVVTSSLERIDAFARAQKERLFVYGPDFGGRVENLYRSLKADAGRRYFVVDDMGVKADPLKQTTAFLSALDQFFSDDPLPSIIERASMVLSRSLDLLRGVSQLIHQSA